MRAPIVSASSKTVRSSSFVFLPLFGCVGGDSGGSDGDDPLREEEEAVAGVVEEEKEVVTGVEEVEVVAVANEEREVEGERDGSGLKLITLSAPFSALEKEDPPPPPLKRALASSLFNTSKSCCR